MSPITIDGSRGEGGGQILRTSLALSLVTGRPFRITNIRAGRKRPGLMRQHLTSVTAAAAVGNARVEGADLGSLQLSFEPGAIVPRHFRFPIGTAGSTMLVLQTVLPALMTASGPSTIVLEGGTHALAAPPFEFIEHVFLPLIARMGPRVEATLDRHGFFPAGGGRVTVRIDPAPLRALHLEERGTILEQRATALLCRLPFHVAERELAVVRDRLGWSPDQCGPCAVDSALSPGNAVLLRVRSEHVTELFTAIGSVGRPAEEVATDAAGQAEAYLRAGVPVGEHLADQLLLPMALAGSGSFLTQPLTPHSTTNIETIGAFLDVPISVTPRADAVRVAVGC